MTRISKLLLVAMMAMTLGVITPSHADCGTGGSPVNPAGSCETSANQVHCAGTDTGDGFVAVSSDGVEYCRQSNQLQGRAGASQDCGCLYIDGDEDNPGVTHGWIKVDSAGAHCFAAINGSNTAPPGSQSYNSYPGQSCI